MDNQTKLDGFTAACAVGGAIAAAVTNYAAAAAIPLAGAVMLQMVNRRQLLDEIHNHGQHLTEEMVQKIQNIEPIYQQQNQFNIALVNQQKQLQIFAEQLQQVQTSLSEQLQQEKENQIKYFETKTEEIGQIRQFLEQVKQTTQVLEIQQQELTDVVDGLKQIENVSQALLNRDISFEMYYERALCHQRLNDGDSAIADFSNAIQLNPHYAKAYHQRGLLRAHQGDRRGAASDLRYAAKYYFDDGDLESYKETRNLSKEFCDGFDEIETPSITQETFDPLTANHLFEVN